MSSISTGFPITGNIFPEGIGFMGSALGSGPAVGPMSLSMTADDVQSTTEVSLRDLVRQSHDGVVVANFGICDDEWCEAVRPDFEIAARRAGDVPFVTVAMQKEENRPAIRKFGIQSYPHIAAFHKGKQVAVVANDRRSSQDFVAIARQVADLAIGAGAGAGAGKSRRKKAFHESRNHEAARRKFQKRKNEGVVLLVKTSIGCGYCTKLKNTLKQAITDGMLACDVIAVEYDPNESITGEAAEAIPQPGVPVTYIHHQGGIEADIGIIVGAHSLDTYTSAVAAVERKIK